MKKYTKKQHEAISSVDVMIDELDNKPRRLFQSLRDFAEAFSKDTAYLPEILSSIDQWEADYYKYRGVPEYAASLFKAKETALRKAREERRLYKKDTDIYEVESALNIMIIEATKGLTDI